jgi:predicted MPP superfamily phosphohydrolase
VVKSVVLVIFLSAVATVYVLEASLLVRFVSGKLAGKRIGVRLLSKPAILLHSLALLGIVCLLYSYFIEPYWIDVRTVTVATEKFKNTSLRIVQISDLHCDRTLRNEKKMVDIVNSLTPDIVVFTGDALNSPEALQTFREVMGKLKAGIGKYAVRGNFDVWYWKDLNLFAKTGFKVLDKETVRLSKNGETFSITGLSCEYLRKGNYVFESVPGDGYSIFLCHYPDLIEGVKGANVDLYLAGHTHGGQVAVPFYGALITLSKYGKRYESGKYVVGKTILYVNRGIGMEGGAAPRIRFWSRPEITVFDITPKR